MRFLETALRGAFVIDMIRTEDSRGFFARAFCSDEFASHGLVSQWPQCNVSFNARKGTLRGLHFQAAPHAEDKVVRCTAGAIFDVIVDLRAGSPTCRRWAGWELSADNHRSLYVPKGFAHGFVSLADESEVHYMMSAPYAPGHARGLRWNDPALAIEWPLQPAVIDARDAAWPLLMPEPAI